VPSGLTNKNQGYARGQLQAAELTPVVQEAPSDTVPKGTVISVDPGEGSEVPVGSEVTLVVSTGPEESGDDPSDDPSGDGARSARSRQVRSAHVLRRGCALAA